MLCPVRGKVIVLGFDGATFDLIKPWAAQGKLPALYRLMEVGAWGPLSSTIPPHSPAAWSTFSTGVNPGKHGVIDFRKRKSGAYDTVLINGSQRHGYPIWKMLSAYGRVVGIVNVPMTYPPEPVNGCFISGMDTPDRASTYTYPSGLSSELSREIGDYTIAVPLAEDVRAGRYDVVYEKIRMTLKQRIRAVRYLLASRDFDFFTVNFSATDAVQHHFWRFMDPSHPQHEEKAALRYGNCIYEIYSELDSFLAEVWSALGAETTLVVMSDHGFGPISNKVLYLNNWLEQQGLFKSKNQEKRGSLRRYVPEFVKMIGRKLMPDLYHRVRSTSSSFFIDWDQTRAFADEYQECVWINLSGRDPQGIVEPGNEYEELRSLIIEGLESLRDPETGLSVVEKVYRREEIYQGAQLEALPDLLVEQRWEPFFRLRPSYTSPDLAPVRTLTLTEIMQDHLPCGVHRPSGVFLATGANIRPGKNLSGLRLVDLPATILCLLGVPVPICFDGRVLQEIFQEPVAVEYTSEYDYDDSFKPREGDDPYGDQDVEAVLERLRGLGYIE